MNLAAATLVSYESCDDMLAGLRGQAAKNVGPWGFGGPVLFARADAIAAKESQDSSAGHSTTNVHEAGVDEPDLVKTDGKRIITVTRGVLRIVDAATRKVTGTLRLVPQEQGWAPADLLVHGDRALVLFSSGGVMPADAAATVKRPAGSELSYVLVDLAGRPKVAGSIAPRNAEHVDARMVGSTVRLVVRSRPMIDFPEPAPTASPEDQPSEQERTRLNREAVERAPIEAWLPKFTVTDAAGRESTRSVACERVSHPREYTGTSMLTVHTLDLAAGERTLQGVEPISVAADGDTVYGTATSLYVTSNPRWWNPAVILEEDTGAPADPSTPAETPSPRPSNDPSMPSLLPEPTPGGTDVAPREAPTPAEPTPSGPVPTEPTPTGPTPIDPAPSDPEPTEPAPGKTPVAPPEKTEVHRFDIGGTGAPRYVASGSVPGRLLNQYSLSEHEGRLRVATTVSDPTTGENSESGVYVLDAATLSEVGRVTGLGKGERIYSVRFIGPVGYVVTFRQIDPLYTLDLRDPAAPRVTGELKITGYSAYLHPAGDGRLIGVGQEASEQGRQIGAQVSLFDVSDPARPSRLAQWVRKNSGIAAEWDPHAFLYWPASGLTVLPINSWDEKTGTSDNGALVLRIGAGGDEITEVGTVRHPETTTEGTAFTPDIRRSLVIGDTLWTVSESGLKASDARTLADQAWIAFS
ncbi:beta-propeller domain-containing protein [Thermocatellispora tengchongensis]|uniref:beta-propeller domain-containing protein n=1 Tax=Thermocatellispora tengchongensis TaxID=1073253 RepID=UPI0036260012